MYKVFKYTIQEEAEDYFSLPLPKGAKILSVQEQGDEPQIWALVDSNAPEEKRNFLLVGTGHPIKENPEALNFIGTFQIDGGAYVGHLFEIIK